MQDKQKNELVAGKNNLPLSNNEEEDLISDSALLGSYNEILNNIRKDRDEVDDILANFVDMVINEGDSSNSSKEALVNLLKIKSDSVDKMTKIADLMTRIKLKEKNTMQDWQKAKSNTINIIDNGGSTKRDLIDAIKKDKKDRNDE